VMYTENSLSSTLISFMVEVVDAAKL
jgi:hypothetical protein